MAHNQVDHQIHLTLIQNYLFLIRIFTLDGDGDEIQYPDRLLQQPINPEQQISINQLPNPNNYMRSWIKRLTRGQVRNVQTMPIPANVVKDFIPPEQRTLLLVDKVGNRYPCELNAVGETRYIGLGWYQYTQDNNLDEDDLLFFYFNDAPNVLYIQKHHAIAH
ncbi:hypothetical protein Fmac_028383 [Flemingia macrophylla]|uniref:TF-B3 domain-containing protein n=1 Tax=Flemingia macrophylla TaxID=520843 RepID=A0ABD1L7C8_9FABA